MTAVHVGLSLPADDAFLDRLGAVLDEPDYFELAPEALWDGDHRAVRPNGFHRRFRELAERTGKRFVAHSIGLGSRDAWLSRLRDDHGTFEFAWYSEHLAITSGAHLALGTPLPIPQTDESAAQLCGCLERARSVVPDVAIENCAHTFVLGDPLREAAFLSRVVDDADADLVLDLHNLYTMAVNHRFDPADYLARLDLATVTEIHVAGGTASDPLWLPGGRVLRLDSHDAPVPDGVWALLEHVAPACPRLRGVTLERAAGTVGGQDVEPLRDELRRIRQVVGDLRGVAPP